MRLLKEGNLGNKVINKLVEEENSFLTTFMNKYKPLYDTKPKISSDGTVIADQIQLKGSGISKRVEAALYPDGNMEVANEEWGFVYTKSGINTDSVESMSQYWFYDDYMNNEEFRAKIDKATASLYKDMVKLRDVSVQSDTTLGESFKKEDNYTAKSIADVIESVDDNYAVKIENRTTGKATKWLDIDGSYIVDLYYNVSDLEAKDFDEPLKEYGDDPYYAEQENDRLNRELSDVKKEYRDKFKEIYILACGMGNILLWDSPAERKLEKLKEEVKKLKEISYKYK